MPFAPSEGWRDRPRQASESLPASPGASRHGSPDPLAHLSPRPCSYSWQRLDCPGRWGPWVPAEAITHIQVPLSWASHHPGGLLLIPPTCWRWRPWPLWEVPGGPGGGRQGVWRVHRGSKQGLRAQGLPAQPPHQTEEDVAHQTLRAVRVPRRLPWGRGEPSCPASGPQEGK